MDQVNEQIDIDVGQRQQIEENQRSLMSYEQQTTTRPNQFEILKEIFVNKEQQLNVVEKKVEELTKELHQLKRYHATNDGDRSDLEKWREELMVNTSTHVSSLLTEDLEHRFRYAIE